LNCLHLVIFQRRAEASVEEFKRGEGPRYLIADSKVIIDDTLPNQIGTPTRTPTLWWVFQMLEGIHHVTIGNGSVSRTLIDGLTNLRVKILRLFGQTVCRIYPISLAGG
jgi:hypothetical protein